MRVPGPNFTKLSPPRRRIAGGCFRLPRTDGALNCGMHRVSTDLDHAIVAGELAKMSGSHLHIPPTRWIIQEPRCSLATGPPLSVNYVCTAYALRRIYSSLIRRCDSFACNASSPIAVELSVLAIELHGFGYDLHARSAWFLLLMIYFVKNKFILLQPFTNSEA